MYTKATQGEIDVIGINHTTHEVFICEVVTHLTTGIQYVKNARPDTADRLIKKFRKDIEYGKAAFDDYAVQYMLWSPVVRRSKGKVEYDQFAHLKNAIDKIKDDTGVSLVLVINAEYAEAIDKLRKFAAKETKELKSPIMRFLQIEAWCRKNAAKLA